MIYLCISFYVLAFKSSNSVVNSYAIKRCISCCTVSNEALAYKFSVIVIFECPMTYCNAFGFMPAFASFVQNVLYVLKYVE